VSEVFGMQHFPAATQLDRLEKVADNIAPFVTGAYEYQGVTWNVFSLSLLARDSRFLDAAV
jgi:hypothetical protein